MRSTGSAPPEALIAWGRETAVSIDDDEALLSVMRGSRVIALGEPGHGAHEPLLFRNRLVRLLAERQLLSAVVIESGVLESRAINAYVLGGRGEAEAIARANITWGFGEQAETVELLRWLREHNASSLNPINFYGFDLPGADNRGELSRAGVTIDEVADYLRRARGAGTAAVLAALAGCRDRFDRRVVHRLDRDERASMRAAIERADEFLHGQREALVQASSEEDFAWALRAARMMRAVFEMFCLWPDVEAASVDLPESTIPSMLSASGVRDVAMAENVLWLLERSGPTGRILVFAANGHVIGDKHRGGLWKGYSDLGLPAGLHLRLRLGDALCVLLCISASVLPGIAQRSIERGSIDTLLAHIGKDRTLLDFRAAPEDPWLDEPQSMRLSIGMEQACVPRTAFDAAAYFERLTPAAQISRL